MLGPVSHIQLELGHCCVIPVVLALPGSPQSPALPCLRPSLLYSGDTMFRDPEGI